MPKKSKNRGVLEVLKNGPENSYGCESQEELDCCKLAEQWLLEAKESLEYRKELLAELIRFKQRISSDSAEFSSSEGC